MTSIWHLVVVLAVLWSPEPRPLPTSPPPIEITYSTRSAQILWDISDMEADTWVAYHLTPDLWQIIEYHEGPGDLLDAAIQPYRGIYWPIRLCAWDIDSDAPGGFREVCWLYNSANIVRLPLVVR